MVRSFSRLLDEAQQVLTLRWYSFSPGRFFVAQELKIMLAHVVLHYDVCLKEPGTLPRSMAFTNYNSPSDSATALFRKRRT